MKAIAIDDEPIALEVIKSHASKVPFLELSGTFTNAFDALPFLKTDDVDLLFLDIKMPDISGIEFLQSLQRKPLVIFTTAYSEYAVTSFELDAVDYLMKPVSFARFLKACNKASEIVNYRNSDKERESIFVKTGYELVKISFGDILYLEASGNYVTFVLSDRKILSRSTFAEAIDLLPPKKFVRIHRSYVVAIDQVQKVERHQVTIGRHVVPVSDAYSDGLQLALRNNR